MYKKAFYISLFLLTALLAGCFPDRNEQKEYELYEGPTLEAENVWMLVSDSSVVRIEMSGAKRWTHQNGDTEFPEGLEIVFYDIRGDSVTVLSADHGYSTNDTRIYKVTGNVVVNRIVNDEVLKTEELFWDQNKKIIYTNKFVTVERVDEIIPAEGLEAKEDFSEYTFIKPRKAIFKINNTE